MRHITPPSVELESMTPTDCLVFGSNLAGRHGAGCAKFCATHLGAKYGQGEGDMGRCYALPTKDRNIETLPLDEIEKGVIRFLNYARHHPEKKFLVTPVGTGLAGYSVDEIAPMFVNESIPDNVSLPAEFWALSEGDVE